jgi:predicted nucleic acid-binding protein
VRIIVADSSTLITLLDTHNFNLLFELFDEIIIADEVYKEITCWNSYQSTTDHYIKQGRIFRQSIEYDEFYEMLIKRLDRGESESIVLAKVKNLPLMIDEKKGRAIAKSLGIGIVGLVGIILKLMDIEAVTKDRAIEIIKEVEGNNFRLSNELKKLIFERQKRCQVLSIELILS